MILLGGGGGKFLVTLGKSVVSGERLNFGALSWVGRRAELCTFRQAKCSVIRETTAAVSQSTRGRQRMSSSRQRAGPAVGSGAEQSKLMQCVSTVYRPYRYVLHICTVLRMY